MKFYCKKKHLKWEFWNAQNIQAFWLFLKMDMAKMGQNKRPLILGTILAREKLTMFCPPPSKVNSFYQICSSNTGNFKTTISQCPLNYCSWQSKLVAQIEYICTMISKWKEKEIKETKILNFIFILNFE